MTVRNRRIAMLFPSAARENHLAEVLRGEAPRDFFYGALHLRNCGVDVKFGDTRLDPPDAVGKLWLRGEILRNRISNFGLSRQRVAALRPDLAAADVAISFTDPFSISLGNYRKIVPGDACLVGGFHGLADMANEVPPLFRDFAERSIAAGIGGLDHLFFFGEADRREIIRRYGIAEAKTSLFKFGVDTKFWSPAADVMEESFILSVGSDPKRDYPTLLAAPLRLPLRIVTRLAVHPPEGRDDVEIVRGSYYDSPITSYVLRDLYRAAVVVVVPVRDVFQPSGYSVTLQAMACGKPVVLSRIKGLWDPEVFVSGENCVLVPPGDPTALGDAITRLTGDAALRRRIGDAASQTARAHFGLERMNRSLASLVERMVGHCDDVRTVAE